jgi:Plasmid recombination enzyme
MNHGDLYFAVGSIGLSTYRGRKPQTLLQAARHNKRAIQAELGAYGHIDAKRICQNEAIAGADNPKAIVVLAQSLMTEAGIQRDKLRKDYTQAIELLFSLPSNTTIDTSVYFIDCLDWTIQQFGAVNILSADIHRDEAAPHCHVLILPLVDNRMAGSALIAKPKTSKLRESFEIEFSKKYGLKFPVRLAGTAKQKAVQDVLQKLQETNDSALSSLAWPSFRQAIERDPAPFMVNLGLVFDAPTKRFKTMAQLAVSKGKGAKYEREDKYPAYKPKDKPIGFNVETEKHRNLCSVGFHPKVVQVNEPIQLPEVQRGCNDAEIIRVRESDLDPALFDPVTGEFYATPSKHIQNNRAMADNWVKAALSK